MATPYVYLIIQAYDQPHTKGIKQGMCKKVVDPDKMKAGFEPFVLKYHAVFKIPRSFNAEEWCKANGDKPKSKYIDLNKFCTDYGFAGYLEKWQDSSESMPIIDCMEMDVEDFLDTGSYVGIESIDDSLHCIVKIGDQDLDGGYTDSEVVSVEDPNEDSWFENPDGFELPYNMGIVFGDIKAEPKDKDYLRSMIVPAGDTKADGDFFINDNYRASKLLVDYIKVQTDTSNPTLITELRSKGVYVQPIDMKKEGLVLDIFKDTTKIDYTTKEKVPDSNAVSGGDVTIGTGGGYSYLTIAAFLSDIAATITSALTATLKTSFTETTSPQVAPDMNSNSVTITSDTDVTGDPSVGHLVSLNANTDFFKLWAYDGTTNINNFRTKHILNVNFEYTSTFYINPSLTGTTVNIKNIIMDGNGTLGGSGFRLRRAGVNHNIHNVICWDYEFYGMRMQDAINVTVNNSHFHNNNYGIATDNSPATGVLKNVICTSNTTADFDDQSDFDATNCYSGDATGTGSWNSESGCVASIVLANEVESTVDTNSEYLKPKSTGQLDDGGTNSGLLADNDEGINGLSRPNSGFTSAGPWQIEFASTGGSSHSVGRGVMRGVGRSVG